MAENELDLLLGTVIDSLVKVSALLYLQERPASALTPEKIALGVGRSLEMVQHALVELGEAKLVTRFPVATGRIVLYGPSEDARVIAMVELLRTRYHESDERRAEVLRKVLRTAEPPPAPRD